MTASFKASRLALAALALLAAGSAAAAPAKPEKELPPKPSLADVVKASKPADWRALDPENTLYMDLPTGRVVIELAPSFAPNTAANIRALVREKYFDDLFIIRSQDGFVVQWGDPDEENPKPFKAAKTIKAEFTAPIKAAGSFTRLKDGDVYAPQVGHVEGFPAARDPGSGQTWLVHCPAMIGVARDTGADSGNGSQLYVVTGHAPRHLDRNITVVGRVVHGMPLLSVQPRGTGAAGFYEKPEQRMPLKRVAMAADVPEAERSKLEVMRTDSATYQAVVEAQRNRGGPWTKVAAGKIDLCNAPIPVREQK
ncbi:peptidylprolyl isomerase [Massilia sp. LC238]|uniref:peptidylprolyl isomerase n=1 Tax=Massilia sp. LC238 TaxID=1502852 RepID=UPI0004E39A25|nr:peptidylprolyl isomerase [Massilia sp. LC238]KFC64226.1 Peptidyl prolyl cis-trans isomerase, cyclophilin type protein PpiB [Massilia sp. LC238]